MSTDHDSLLSAYLDGQVDPDQKRRAESVLATDPDAVEALNRLAAVRDLVAGLARPRAPEELASGVLNRLAVEAARPRLWKTWAPYVGRGLGASALAASVTLVVVLGADGRIHGVSDAPVAGSTPPLSVASTPAPAPAPVPTLAASPPARPEVDETGELKPTPPAAPTPVVQVADHPTPERVLPSGFRELWDTAGPRRDFVVTSGPGEPTTATVASLLGLSTHRNFFKIVIPASPEGAPQAEGAVAFAANLDPKEFATLRRRLESGFGDRVSLSESDPEVTALLAEVGHATTASPTPAGDVSFPPAELAAIRTPYNPETSASSRSDASDSPDASTPVVIPNPVQSAIVLIWIVVPTAK